jgi:hypothetical protein
MVHDVDLLRDLLFMLEQRQVSPRATIIVSIDEASYDLNRMPDDIAKSLGVLQALDYIEGPGQDEPGVWLFRKLTRKGVQFVRQMRNPRAWEQMKSRFASQQMQYDA